MKSLTLLGSCCAMAGMIAFAPAANAQRTTTTTTTRTDPVTRADVIFHDVTCRLSIHNKKVPVPVWVKSVASSDGEELIPTTLWGSWVFDGQTTKSPSTERNITAWIIVKNAGTRLSKFQVRVNGWKPPGAWSFVDGNTGEPIPVATQTVSLTLESGITKAVGPFYLKPAFGRFFFVVDAITDSGHVLDEANETNNTCRTTFTVEN